MVAAFAGHIYNIGVVFMTDDNAPLAEQIRTYRSHLLERSADQDHLQNVVPVTDVAENLERILEAADEPPAVELELEVQYRNRVTVVPPDLNEDGTLSPAEHRRAAEDWLHNNRDDIVRDFIDAHEGDLEVLAVRRRDGDA